MMESEHPKHTEAKYTDFELLSSFRLYAKARILGYTRGKRNQKPTTSLVQIEGVANKEEADFYLGKVRLPTS